MLILAALLFLFPALQKTEAPAPRVDTQGCKKFVQDFYTWYLPRMAKGQGMELAFKHRTPFFTRELVRAFNEESSLQNRHPDLVGALDFDPFLDTQDPYDQYVVGDATARGTRCFVDVFGSPGGKKNAKPDVIAELVQVNGAWRFANFHYKDEKGKESDILGLLRVSKKDWLALEAKERKPDAKKPH